MGGSQVEGMGTRLGGVAAVKALDVFIEGCRHIL